jgi:hypothetical protein
MTQNIGMPEQRHSRTRLIVAIAATVVVVLIVVGALFAYYTFQQAASKANAINITGVNYQVSGCGFNSFTGTGGTTDAGTTATFTSTWHYNGFLGFGSCTINSVSTDTPGFSLVSSNAPLVINGGSTQTLTVTVETPSSSYTGVLDIIVNAS